MQNLNQNKILYTIFISALILGAILMGIVLFRTVQTNRSTAEEPITSTGVLEDQDDIANLAKYTQVEDLKKVLPHTETGFEIAFDSQSNKFEVTLKRQTAAQVVKDWLKDQKFDAIPESKFIYLQQL